MLVGVALVLSRWRTIDADDLAVSLDNKSPGSPVADAKFLGGDDRYLTHLSTDKPIYRVGETVCLRGVVLHHITHRPQTQAFPFQVEIVGPQGDVIAKGVTQSQQSVVGFQWQIPSETSGGQYRMRVSHPFTGDTPVERKFEIRDYRVPRLKSQITFLRDGYGPGDEVVAFLTTSRAEGGSPTGAKVTIVARVDDLEVYQGQTSIDEAGHCTARFHLPSQIQRGDGTLAMIIEDGGVLETATKTIPILLQNVDLTVYPEGGPLVAGLANRVYFEAFTPAGKPADIAGIVVDQMGNRVCEFRSEHEGRGRFEFTPRADREYFIEITEPTGIAPQFPLPRVVNTGVTLRAVEEVYAPQSAVRVGLASVQGGDFVLTIMKREKVLSRQSVSLAPGAARSIDLHAGEHDGVLTVTAFDSFNRPLAERLVFRQPERTLAVQVEADQTEYVPGGRAKLKVTTTDDTGKRLPAVLGLAVTDDVVLEMVETREQPPRLPVMVLLEHDVRNLADAHIYLDRANNQAPRAVDLLLGTQGWRRFAIWEIGKFANTHQADIRRVLAWRIPVLQRRARDVHWFRAQRVLPAEAIPLQLDKAEVVRLTDLAVPRSELRSIADRADDGVARFAIQQDRFLRQSPDQEQLVAQEAAELFRFRGLGLQAEPGDIRPFVREFAHRRSSNRPSNERTDFKETLYWCSAIHTDANGRASVEFDLNDAVTSFSVLADAFNQQGWLGSSKTILRSVEPFYVDPKMPLEVSSGDILRIPLSLVNSTSAVLEQGRVSIRSDSWRSVETDQASFSLGPQQRGRKLLGVQVGSFHGPAELTISASAGPYSDQIRRKLTVRPWGFPIEEGHGGMIEPNSSVRHTLLVPAETIPGSVRARIVVHPTPLASLTEALARLIREPHGCFEQASSTVFPMVMAQRYFQSHVGVDPDLIQRTHDMLNQGYTRLVGFECPTRGYEWFGADPGHDALTAYGLMEFTEMARVREVDRDMLQRTAKWLLSQRDGQGGYVRKTHTLHTWIADPACANTYNTWALLEAGSDADLTKEVAWVRDAAAHTKNSYVLALATNVLWRASDRSPSERDVAVDLCRKLTKLQSADGAVSGATISVIGSTGEALTIEATALAVSAWLQDARFVDNVEKGIQFLAASCQSGRFGSTQSTVLALRAIVAYDAQRAAPRATGSLRVSLDGQLVGEPVTFDERTQCAIELPDISGLLIPGHHTISLEMSAGSRMPYAMSVSYHTVKPNSSPDCRLRLEAKLTDTTIAEGDITEARVVLANQSTERVPSPVAIIGIPGGLEPRHNQLKELVSAGRIAAYEVMGREVILYWRALDANDRLELPISLIAAVPGRYTGPASRAYLYYTDEHKHWVDGTQIEIRPATAGGG
jgi:hypothetical protein